MVQRLRERTDDRGMTLIEIMVVIVILGVLLKDVIERDLRNLWIIATALIVLGLTGKNVFARLLAGNVPVDESGGRSLRPLFDEARRRGVHGRRHPVPPVEVRAARASRPGPSVRTASTSSAAPRWAAAWWWPTAPCGAATRADTRTISPSARC